MTQSFKFADLLPSLYDGYVRRWSYRRILVLRTALETGARRPTEPMVTDLIAAADKHLADALIRCFLDAVGRPNRSTSGLTLMTGTDFRSKSPGLCRHVPDLLVCDDETFEPIIVIEGKLHAWVNGGPGYCRAQPNLYNNQATAYVEGCWTRRSLDWSSFLWLGPDVYLEHAHGPWGPKALGPEDHVHYANVDAGAWERQEAARLRWRGLSWEALMRGLGSHPSSLALAQILRVWVRT